MYKYIYIYLYLFIYLSLSLSIYLPIYLSIQLSIYLSFYLSKLSKYVLSDVLSNLCRLMQTNADMCRDDCKQEARSHIKPHNATTRPEPKGSLRPFIKCLGMSSQPLGRASKTGTPETCPKSSVIRCPFVEGKLANTFPNSPYIETNADNFQSNLCMPMQTNADKCRLMPINTQMIANKRREAK